MRKTMIKAKIKMDKDEDDYLVLKINKNYIETNAVAHLIDALQGIEETNISYKTKKEATD